MPGVNLTVMRILMAVITLHVPVDDFRQLWFFKHATL